MERSRLQVTIVQVAPGTSFARLRTLLADHPADLYALPEYLTAAPAETTQAETAEHFRQDMEALESLSRHLGAVVLGGTLIEPVDGGLANVSPCLERGALRGLQRKIHPTPGEHARGIVPGRGLQAAGAAGVRVVTLICADVLHPGSFEEAAAARADIVFVPATSPLRPGEDVEDKKRRDRDIFLAGARRARAFVVKACAIGRVYGGALQGRSLVAAPWGEQLARVPFHLEDRERLLHARLDLSRLRSWRCSREQQGGGNAR